MDETEDVTFWFRYYNKKKVIKLKNRLSQMHPMDIKRLFEKLLRHFMFYDEINNYSKVLAIYMLSDDALKLELDRISMELQNKKIEVNIVPIEYDLTQKKERTRENILMWLGL